MIYYRVKKEYDQKVKNYKTYDIYIVDELYTLSEIAKQKLNMDYFDIINISKNKVYWSFGARFEKNNIIKV